MWHCEYTCVYCPSSLWSNSPRRPVESWQTGQLGGASPGGLRSTYLIAHNRGDFPGTGPGQILWFLLHGTMQSVYPEFFRHRYFFPRPNFPGTSTGTFSRATFFRFQYFFRDQFFPVPVLFSGSDFSGTGTFFGPIFVRSWYRYHPKSGKFPVILYWTKTEWCWVYSDCLNPKFMWIFRTSLKQNGGN